MHTPFRHNLSRNETSALEQLSSRQDVFIKPADKGGAIVVMNREDYINEANRQLSNSLFYQALPNDPTSDFKSKVKEMLL